MTQTANKQVRILAVAPSPEGFGFAVLEGGTLADWGIKWVGRNKNAQCVAKVKELIGQYQPQLIVLEDASAKESLRAPRIRALTKKFITLASGRQIKTCLFSRKQIQAEFFAQGRGTNHALAEILAGRFPEELGCQLPYERKPWMCEDPRIRIFTATALALMVRTRE